MDLSLFFAGTAGAAPTPRRGLPATLLRAGGWRILIDCGEGTQRQLIRSVGLPDLDAIFLTHYHADHWLGLPGLLKTFDLRDRDKPLEVYGPPGLRAIMDRMQPILGRSTYPLELVELDRYEEVRFDSFVLESFPVDHRAQAYGYAFIEDDRPGRFDPKRAQELGIKPGPDFKRLQDGETVDGVEPDQVMGERRSGRKLVITGDTRPCQTTEEYAHKAQVLVHDSTFTEAERERAQQTGHSTAAQAAQLAAAAEVEMLCLVHLSQRVFPRDIRDEARTHFPGAQVPRDFEEVVVPFPERGAPRLVGADDVVAEEISA